MTESRMYKGVKTWNPFKGCLFDCEYCKPSFQLQAKRQKHNCMDCYNYTPHEHLERIDRIPNAETVFVCGNGDISFARKDYTREIINAIRRRNEKHPDRTYYFQSKRPEYFETFTGLFPGNVIVLTTIETNRDNGYHKVSKAPPPSKRYRQFSVLDYPRKVITIEPIMDFDLDVFSKWIIDLNPEYVWLGFNSRPKQVRLPDPTEEKVDQLMKGLTQRGIKIFGKELRGLTNSGSGSFPRGLHYGFPWPG